MKALLNVRNISQLIFLSLAVTLITAIIIANIAPFGISVTYNNSNSADESISKLGPADRVEIVTEDTGRVISQKEDLVYFTTKHLFHYDTATVKITYKNPHLDQELYLGFQDKESWHYDTQILDAPLMEGFNWTKVGSNPVLYQKNKKYSSVQSFMENPPEESIIGVYKYEDESLNNPYLRLPDYKPSNEETVIDTVIRGNHIMYAYLQQEPFTMTLTKQDLNWYTGEDVVNIKIYKDSDLVYFVTIEDDGIIDSSQKPGNSQYVTLQNPGPELPENGVYKVVIEAGGDTVIKQIRTNLHKIVFADQIFLAGNKDVYKVVNETNPTTLYTNALVLTAKAIHNQGKQKIKLENETIDLNTLNTEVATKTPEVISEVTIPNNDVILQGVLGYFSFTKDQLFIPTPLKIIQVNEKSDLEIVDYLLTTYDLSRHHQDGEWEVAEATFDLSNAVVKDGRLSWVIKAPNLRANNRKITIKKIEVKLTKEPMITYEL